MKRFLNYFRTISHEPLSASVQWGAMIAVIFMFVFNSVFGKEAAVLAFLGSFAFMAALVTFPANRETPNLETAFPADHKKKLLYRFLSALLAYALMMLCIFSFLGVALLLVLAISPSSIEKIFENVGNILSSAGVYGGLYAVANFVILYSAGMLTGLIKRRKPRNIFLTVLCVSIFISYYLMGIPYYNSNLNPTHGFAGPYLNVCYEAMKAPYVAIILWFLLAAGMLGFAVYLGIKHYDPKKF